jgi:cytochrome c556
LRYTKQALVPFVAAFFALVGASIVAFAADPDPAHERHEAMEEIGDAMKALGAIAKKEAPFDAAVVKANATTIADNLKKASTLFPPGSGGGESLAKPEVWTDRETFDKTMKDAQAAAVALQMVSVEAAYGPALGALGGNCKACHDKFRLPPKK